MGWTDNPLADFNRHDAEQQEWLESRPKCSCCEEPIQDDYLYEIDGEYICEDCLNSEYRKRVDYVVGW